MRSRCSGVGLATSGEAHGRLLALAASPSSHQAKRNSYLQKPARVDAPKIQINASELRCVVPPCRELRLNSRRSRRQPIRCQPLRLTREQMPLGYAPRVVLLGSLVGVLWRSGQAVGRLIILAGDDAREQAGSFLLTRELHLGNQHRHFLHYEPCT